MKITANWLDAMMSGGRTFLLPDGKSFIRAKDGKNVYLRISDRRTDKHFCWTTVPDNHGRYWSWVWVPVGPGSRSGHAKRWVVRRLGWTTKRRIAKDRAVKAWQTLTGRK